MISRSRVAWERTVANDGSIDDESKQGLLVGSSVVLQESCGVVVTHGDVLWPLGDSKPSSGRDGESLEKHDG